jgi:hypothetical protein
VSERSRPAIQRLRTIGLVGLVSLGGCDVLTGPGEVVARCSEPGVVPGSGASMSALADIPFPIVAWHGVPKEDMSPGQFERLAAAGFTINYTARASRATNLRILDLAAEAGVRALIDDFALRADSPFDRRAVREAVAQLGTHSGLFGYQLREEPPATLFPRVGLYADSIRDIDPDHVIYSNLYPDYALSERLGTPSYDAYLSGYIRTVRPGVISAAYYPLYRRGFRSGYFAFMERLRSAAFAADADFWAFAMTAHIEPEYPRPRESWIRFQVFSALAHGARGIEYFPYSLPRSPTEDFRVAILDSAGMPTYLYSIVDRVNAEVMRLAPTLRLLRSVRVCRSPDPLGADRIEWGLDGVERSRGLPVLLGRFSGEGADYLMLVSLDLESPGTLELRLAPGVEALIEVPRTAEVEPARLPVDGGTVAVRLQPGDGRLFRLR